MSSATLYLKRSLFSVEEKSRDLPPEYTEASS